MLRLLKALINLTREVRRIKEILEIVHQPELEYHRLGLEVDKAPPLKASEAEFTVSPLIRRDDYGQIIEDPNDDD